MQSSSCTMEKMVRWRLLNWASCFFANKFPLGEDERHRFRHSLHRIPNARKSAKRKTMRRKERNKKLGISDESTRFRSPQDDDFINFRFKEGGLLEIVNNDHTTEAIDSLVSTGTSPWNNTIKDSCCSEAEPMKVQSEMIPQAFIAGDYYDFLTIERWKENPGFIEIESQPDAMTSSLQSEEESEHSGSESSETLDESNISESSAGSFSFPVLPWEYLGSPAQMPKGCHTQTRMGRFHCCRF